MQIDGGRYFLYEQPWTATSWEVREMVRFMNQAGLYMVRGDMCPHGMTSVDEYGTAPVLKPTGWLTNSYFISEEVGQRCTNLYEGGQHRHVHLVSGKARAAQIYPVKLCLSILRGLRNQLVDDRLMHKTYIGSVCCEETNIPSDFNGCSWEDFNDGVEPKCLGSPVDGEVQYYDDISGAPLPTELVENAIKEEMAEYAKHEVYEFV